MENIDAFIKAQEAKNTARGNITAKNAVHRYMKSVDDEREVSTISEKKLNIILCNFIIEGRKLDGGNYEPDVLSTMIRSLQRYLNEEKYIVNILKDSQFARMRETLASKRKQMKKTNKIVATRLLTYLYSVH